MVQGRKYTINGETKTAAQFGIEHNLPKRVISQRIKLGWTYPDVFMPKTGLGDKRIKHNGEKIVYRAL